MFSLLTYEELTAKFQGLKDAYKAIFPNGYIAFSKPSISEGSFFITVMLQQPKDCTNQIPQNDPMRTVYAIYTSLVQNDIVFTLELCSGNRLSINPTNPMLAMSSVKLAFRKTTGNEEKVIKAFTTHMTKRKTFINEHKDNIYQVNKINPMYL